MVTSCRDCGDWVVQLSRGVLPPGQRLCHLIPVTPTALSHNTCHLSLQPEGRALALGSRSQRPGQVRLLSCGRVPPCCSLKIHHYPPAVHGPVILSHSNFALLCSGHTSLHPITNPVNIFKALAGRARCCRLGPRESMKCLTSGVCWPAGLRQAGVRGRGGK